MQKMHSHEYEKLVSSIVRDICNRTKDLQSLDIGSGRKNKISGASGYRHQIDISMQDSNRLFIVECKCWRRPIGVQEVLVLATRCIDISENVKEKTIHKIIVSNKPATAGANKLAEHFGVQLEIANSVSEFGLRIGKHVTSFVTEVAVVQDECIGKVVKSGAEC